MAMQHSKTQYRIIFLLTFLSIVCLVSTGDQQQQKKSTPAVNLFATKPIAHYDFTLTGRASWYGVPFHGRTTANGETYNMNALTAAHKTLPFGSIIKVTNLANSKSVLVRINDRGPYIRGRQIDLSYAAAQKIDMVSQGVSPIKMEILLAKKTLVRPKSLAKNKTR